MMGLEKVNESKCLHDFIRIKEIQVDKELTKIYIFFSKIPNN